MVIEALATGGILLVGPAESKIAGFIGFALLCVAVAVTVFRAVPLHVRIARGQSHLVLVDSDQLGPDGCLDAQNSLG